MEKQKTTGEGEANIGDHEDRQKSRLHRGSRGECRRQRGECRKQRREQGEEQRKQ